jgi:hypothetical protein
MSMPSRTSGFDPDPGPSRRTGPRTRADRLRLGLGLAVALAALVALLVWLSASGRAASSASADAGPSRLNRLVAGWLARSLVEPARPGEAIVPAIRFEQPWPQALALVILAGSIALVVALYRREASGPAWYRGLLAALRIAAIVLAMFMLSEAVLSVERTGLPTFVILVDDSASTGIAELAADAPAALTEKIRSLARAAAAAEATPAKNASTPNTNPSSDVSRLAAAQGWLLQNDAKLLRDLQAQHKLRLYLVSDTARMLAQVESPDQLAPALDQLRKAEPIGNQTRLGDAVREVLTELRGAPPTAILLLTDGQTTEGEPLARAAEFARTRGVPIFPIGLGDPAPARDLELADFLVDDVVFLDDQVRFEARLTSRGFAGEKVEVTLLSRPADADPAKPASWTPLATLPLTAPPDGQSRRVEIPFRPMKAGSFVYQMVIEPRPREVQIQNNQVTRPVSVREEKVKVLLVEGEPRYEFRYLLSFLKRDRSIEVKTVLQSADPEYAEQEDTAIPTFPTAKDGPDGLFAFDAVVFGDVDLSLFSSAQVRNLVDFVEQKGGGVLFIAGQAHNPLAYATTPLAPLFPIRISEARDPATAGRPIPPIHLALSPEGRNHPIFRFADDEAASLQVLEGLPPFDWFLEVPRKQELAFVLASHPELQGSDGPMPLLLYQYVGAGKVVFQAFDETWKWRFRIGDRYFGRYWIQTLRFLARSKLLGKQAELTTDRRRYQRQQPIRVQVRFPNPALAPASGDLKAEVRKQGQGPRPITLRRSAGASNLFEGVLPQAAVGSYEVRLLPPPVLEGGMPTASFTVDAPAGEFEHIPMNEPELVRTAGTTRGKFLTPTAPPDQLLAALPAPQTVPLDTDPPIALWNAPPVLGLFLLLLALEWVLRKRKQMV